MDKAETKQGEQANGVEQTRPNTDPQGEGFKKPETDRA